MFAEHFNLLAVESMLVIVFALGCSLKLVVHQSHQMFFLLNESITRKKNEDHRNTRKYWVFLPLFICSFVHLFIYLFPQLQLLQSFSQQLSYRRMSKAWFTEDNNDTILILHTYGN